MYVRATNIYGNTANASTTFYFVNPWTAHGLNASWSSVASSIDGSKLVAVGYNTQIYTSTDSGVTWTPRDSSRNWFAVTSSANGNNLAAVVYTGQIYTSTDSGVTWIPRDSNRSWTSIASSEDGSKLVAVVSNGQIYTSTNYGVTWTPRDSSRHWYGVTSSTDGKNLAAIVSAGGQIYTSTDYGVTWTPRDSGRKWNSITSSSDGSKLAAVEWSGQIYTSTDFGVTWTPRESNRGWVSITSSSDGSKLAAVVQVGQIYKSTDYGVTWVVDELNRNWYSITSSADGSKLAAVNQGGQIYTNDYTAPPILITRPILSSTVYPSTWNPLISWGDSVTCKYSYDNFVSSTTVSCANNGSDILEPTIEGSATLYIRGIDSSSVQSNASSTFSNIIFVPKGPTINPYGITSSADGSKLVVGSSGGQIYTSTDYGVTWTPRDSNRTWRIVVSSADGSKLAIIVQNGQIYTSTDYGVTWTPRDSARAWRGIASSADGSKLAAVVNNGQIYTSTDSGLTWTARDSNRAWTSITSSADGSKLVAVAGAFGTANYNYIYTSTDYGVTWTPRDSKRYWTGVTSSADGSKLAAITVASAQIYTSIDSGLTWTPRESNRSWYGITSSADGSKLAATVNSGQVYTSTDYGVTWKPRGATFGWTLNGITSSADGNEIVSAAYGQPVRIYQNPTPSLSVISLIPSQNQVLTSWSPYIAWGTAVTCQYSMDGGATTTVSCANNGSDIVSSTGAGQHTLALKGIDVNSVVATSSVSFTYTPPLVASTINRCGEMLSPGTYTLSGNITGVSGVCFNVKSSDVTINGAGYSVTAAAGNTNVAVSAGTSTNLTLSNISFSGFAGGFVNSSSSVTYSGDNVDISNSTTTVNTLTINYTNSLITGNTFFSALSSLFVNGIDLGSFAGGLFSWHSQSGGSPTCQTITSQGTYEISDNINEVSATCFNIQSDNVIIDGKGHTITAEEGNTSYAFDATSNVVKDQYNQYVSGGNGHKNIIIKNLTLVGFGGGITSKGFDNDGNTLARQNGFNGGGNIYISNVVMPTNIIAINTSGGIGADNKVSKSGADGGSAGTVTVSSSTIGSINANGGNSIFDGFFTGRGGNAASVTLINSRVGNISINGGNSVGDINIGTGNGTVQGGTAGTVSNTNSITGAVSMVVGLGYIPGCTDNSFDTYNASATYYVVGSCNNLTVGSQRDNLVGHTITPISGSIDFYDYHNRGTVTGDANFHGSATNYGTVTGNATFEYGGNSGTIGGNADFTQGGSYQAYNSGTVNGSATFYSSSHNSGTVLGTITDLYGCTDTIAQNHDPFAQSDDGSCQYVYGCTDPSAQNYNPSAQQNDYSCYYGGCTDPSALNYSPTAWYDDYSCQYNYIYGCTDPSASNYNPSANSWDGSCQYYGSSIDNPVAHTIDGTVTFSGHNNYGTVNGDAYFNSGGINYGTVTGSVYFNDFTSFGGILMVDGSGPYNGTGVVSGTMYDTNYTPITEVDFSNGYNNTSTTSGSVVFNDTSYNTGTISGNALFNGASYNTGNITGNATLNTTYYSDTAPTTDTLTLSGSSVWSGLVSGTVFASDGTTPITKYRFNDQSQNLSTIKGDMIINSTYYNPTISTTSTLTLAGSAGWKGSVTGNIYASDEVTAITRFIFNDSSTNFTNITGETTFNNNSKNSDTIVGDPIFYGGASNEGTITGNPIFLNNQPFKIGTVNGTSTLMGTNQTIKGGSTANLVKNSVTRESLYLSYSDTLTVQNNLVLRGKDASTLLSVRSTIPGRAADINISGTADIDFVNLKNVHNNGTVIDLRGKTVYDEGGNIGFIFNSNSGLGQHTNITNPPDRKVYTPPPPPPPTPTPTPTPSTSKSTKNSKGTGSTYMPDLNLLNPINLKPIPVFTSGINSGKNLGTTNLPNPISNINSVGKIKLKDINYVFAPKFSELLFSSLPDKISSILKDFSDLKKYFETSGLNAQRIVSLNSNPLFLPLVKDMPKGLFTVKDKLNKDIPILLKGDETKIYELVKVDPGETLKIGLLSTTKGITTAKYGTDNLVFNNSVTTLRVPVIPGRYTLTSTSSPISLVFEVVAPQNKPIILPTTLKPPSIWQRLTHLFTG